jgi:hypothetical protein
MKGKGVAMVTMVRYEMWGVVKYDDGEAERYSQTSGEVTTTNMRVNPMTLCSGLSCICKCTLKV